MRVTQVDLDALGNIAGRLTGLECEEDAAVVGAAVAELRELRALVGCATVFEFDRCTVANTTDGSKWILERTQNLGEGVVFAHRDEALAAARKWEAEHA